MKTKLLSILTILSLLMIAVTACAAPTVTVTAADTPAEETEAVPSSPTAPEQGETVVPAPSGGLSEEEADGLLYMREEEKLARDVYLALYDRWGLPVFQNISRSEQTHTDAVKDLLDRYGLDDPAADKERGEFTNPDLQALYDSLVETGSRSLVDALRVGAAIEEIDILDLEERIAQTDEPDIQQVYENLMNGSGNHLRAFVSSLEREGETYSPQYLTQEAYDAIMGGSTGGPQGQGEGKGSGNGGPQGGGNGGMHDGGRWGGGRGGRGSSGGSGGPGWGAYAGSGNSPLFQ